MWGDVSEQSPREQGQDPPLRAQDCSRTGEGWENTQAPNQPTCIAGSLSWELQGGTVTGQEEELPEGGGCVAVGAQSARLVKLKRPVSFLSYSSPAPTSPLETCEGRALGCFTQHPARPS